MDRVSVVALREGRRLLPDGGVVTHKDYIGLHGGEGVG